MKIEFTVHGAPVPKARARSVMRGNHIAHYTPKKTVDYEGQVKTAAVTAMRGIEKITGAATLCVAFYMPIPKSYNQEKREDCINNLMMHTKKPDIDNLIKSVKDALNGVVWLDDSQVVRVYATKKYSENPRAVIEVGGL